MGNRPVLEGIKVLDFTIALSGAYLAWQLADFGAEVWKVEKQKVGDQARYWDPCVDDFGGQSTLFMAYNKNKKSIEINLADPEGKQIIYDMAKECDIVIENFKSGSINKLGLGYEVLKQYNPKIVFLSLSGFGGSGPLMKLPCYDAIAAARGGFAAGNGEPDGAPMKAGNANCDTITASYGLNAVLMGLINAKKTGEGCHIDIGMSDTVMSTVAEQVIDYSTTASEAVRFGNYDRFTAPYGIFDAKDGWISIIADSEDKWAKLCDALKLDIKDDARFKDNKARVEHKEELAKEIEKATSKLSKADAEKLLLDAGVPAAQMMSFIEVYTSDQANKTGALERHWQEKVGMMNFYTNPLRFNNEQYPIRLGSPLLGQHTSEILKELGYSEEKISDLYSKEVIFSTLI